MTRRVLWGSAIGVLLAAILLVGRAGGEVRCYRLHDGKVVPLSQMTEEVAAAKVLFIGEEHDSVAHHRVQLALIKELHREGKPVAIAMEMFTAASQPLLDRWTHGTLPEREMKALFSREWRMPWSLYRNILYFVRDHQIPLVGLNVSRELVRSVARKGFSALDENERRQLPPGITCNVDAAYRAFIERAYRQHRTGEGVFRNFCEAQMVWNKGMAWHLRTYRAREPSRLVVVIAGTGHVLRQGMPSELSEPASRIVVQETREITPRTLTSLDADYVVLSAGKGVWP